MGSWGGWWVQAVLTVRCVPQIRSRARWCCCRPRRSGAWCSWCTSCPACPPACSPASAAAASWAGCPPTSPPPSSASCTWGTALRARLWPNRPRVGRVSHELWTWWSVCTQEVNIMCRDWWCGWPVALTLSLHCPIFYDTRWENHSAVQVGKDL